MKKRIWVAGSANTDVVLHLDRLPGRGESVIAPVRAFNPGGKGANRAVALARLGAQPVFSCCLGDDSHGEQLREVFSHEGIDGAEIELLPGVGTGTAYIFLESDGSNRIVVYPGANDCYGEEKVKRTASLMGGISMLSLELEIPLKSAERLIFEAAAADVPCVVDAGPVKKDVSLKMFSGAYILSPNETEAFALTGVEIGDDDSAREACRALYSAGVKYALIKLGARGSVCYDGSEYIFCPAVDAGKVVDTTAAGDCYMAGLCHALSVGMSIERAMHYASAVAGISVTRPGAIPSLPYAWEVRE